MIHSATDRARALDRMNTAARRAPTPAMVAKAAAIGRKVDALAKRMPGPIVVGTSFAEAKRIAADGERLMQSARQFLPISLSEVA